MSTKASRTITQLRQADFKRWHFTLWLLKRQLDGRNTRYSALSVDADSSLQRKLKGALTGPLSSGAHKLVPYDYQTEDQDDNILTIDQSESGFDAVQAAVDKGTNASKAETFEDFIGAWAYVVKLSHGDDSLYGVRKISQYTRAAKLAASGKVAQVLFRDKQLTDLEGEKVLTLDVKIDFYVFGGIVFIANKRDFESVMNFREGMERNRDEVVSDLGALGVFSDVEPIRTGVGFNLPLLRKISAIRKSEYYKNPEFIKGIIEQNAERGWGRQCNCFSVKVRRRFHWDDEISLSS